LEKDEDFSYVKYVTNKSSYDVMFFVPPLFFSSTPAGLNAKDVS